MFHRFGRLVKDAASRMNKRSAVCLSASMASWILNNDSEFNAPTFEDVKKSLKEHDSNSNDMMQINHQFFEDEYSKLIQKFSDRFTNTNRREILSFIPQIFDNIKGLKNSIVIEVGPGTGTFASEFSKYLSDDACYVGCDISGPFIYYLQNDSPFKFCRNMKFNLSKTDSLCLPSQLKGEIDVVFMAATYHHLDNVNETLEEIYDYLKPGGKLIVVDFKKPEKKWYHDHQHDIDDQPSLDGRNMFKWMKGHIRFTEREAKEEITTNGFIYDYNIMPENWKYHFIHVYKKPSFF